MKVHYFEHYATNGSYWYREHPGNDREGYISLEDAEGLFSALTAIFETSSDSESCRIAKRAMLAVGGPAIITEQPDEDDDE